MNFVLKLTLALLSFVGLAVAMFAGYTATEPLELAFPSAIFLVSFFGLCFAVSTPTKGFSTDETEGE